MKAISVRQPHAWCLVTDIQGSPVGNKIVENRSWHHPYRGDLLIVSSQKMIDHAGAVSTLIEEHTGRRPLATDPHMALGSILGVVEMVACLKVDEYKRALMYARKHDVEPMTIIQAVDSGRVVLGKSFEEMDLADDWWACGPWCHVYVNVRRLPPVRTPGRLGLWDLKTVNGEPIEDWVTREGVRVR